ncbi:MAG TPA: hypothetical protein VKT32_13385 [Chthonomonadaceae bacterium]|nr:hypothetical protein [Chthonomonadaceae bacterium]
MLNNDLGALRHKLVQAKELAARDYPELQQAEVLPESIQDHYPDTMQVAFVKPDDPLVPFVETGVDFNLDILRNNSPEQLAEQLKQYMEHQRRSQTS